MDDPRPQSLFVVLSYGYRAPYFSSIVLLEKNANNLQYAAAHLTSEGRPKMKKIKRSSSLSSLDKHQNQKEHAAHLTSEGLRGMKRWYSRWCSTYSLDLQKDYVAHLAVPGGYPSVSGWTFCSPTISADLCVVPDSGSPHNPIDAQLKGCLLNLRTKDCKSFQPPKSCRYYQHAVAVGEHIYFLTHLSYNRRSFFKQYDPVKGLWQTLEPFAKSDIRGSVFASAVLDDTIVFNIGFKLWAYNIGRNKWYEVCVDDTECYSIIGEAVVLNNTIYALTRMSCGLVLALSIEKKEINDDLEFYCSPPSKIVLPGMEENKIVLPGMEENKIVNKEEPMWESRHLVHLGGDNFCLVRSCRSFLFVDYQPIQVTYIKLEKGENLMMNVTGTFIYKLKILQKKQFHVRVCFSLPDCKTAALKEGKGSVLEFNPYPEDYASEQKNKNQEAEVPEVSPPPGHSIYVRNLARNANVKKVEQGLKKFGAIKRDGIQVLKNRKGKGKHAIVEFECADSKKRAIEASCIKIGGFSAEILEKR